MPRSDHVHPSPEPLPTDVVTVLGKIQRIDVLEREIKQMAQMVHQAYHQDIGGVWQDCPRGVCQRARSVLEEKS